jgi:hypothetical protein
VAGGGAVGATAAGEGVGALTTLERAALTFTTPFCCRNQDGSGPPPDNWVFAEETCRFRGGYGVLRGGTGAAGAGAEAGVSSCCGSGLALLVRFVFLNDSVLCTLA